MAKPQLPSRAANSPHAAVTAVKAGADDFIVKDPYLEDKLELSVEKIERMLAQVKERLRLEEELQRLKEERKKKLQQDKKYGGCDPAFFLPSLCFDISVSAGYAVSPGFQHPLHA